MACGFVYYFNPSSAVACFIKNAKGELLLVRRGKEPAKGTLICPVASSICLSRGGGRSPGSKGGDGVAYPELPLFVFLA